MIGIHVRLDLEDEAGHRRLVRGDLALLRHARPRRRGEGGEPVDQVANAEILQRAAEHDRRQMALAKRGEVEGARGGLGERDLLGGGLAIVLRQVVGERRGVEGRHRHQRAVAVDAADRAFLQIVDAGEGAPHAERPVQRRGVERQPLLDLLEQLERMPPLAVHLVDEGDDRDVAQPADLEQLERARLDATGGVDDHDGGIDRGQRAVGVLGKILVARRVEQIEDRAVMLEGHHRGDDGDAAIALHLHPVGAGLAAARLGTHLAGKLDGAAEEQQLLGQRRLAGVRMRNDREGAAAPGFVGKGHRMGLWPRAEAESGARWGEAPEIGSSGAQDKV